MDIFILSGVLLVGFVVGFLVALFGIPTSRTKDVLHYQGQQMLIMYLIEDEIYRKRLSQWMTSPQAARYSHLIQHSIRGKLHLLPLEDTARIDKIIESIETTLRRK